MRSVSAHEVALGPFGFSAFQITVAIGGACRALAAAILPGTPRSLPAGCAWAGRRRALAR
eukprot:1385329-Pyramimonas_sp.AAC.1